jgi:hypothetical protein
VLAVPTWILLGSIVVAATAVHVVASIGNDLPSYFPDEYLYAEISRSLWSTGHPFLHGGNPHFHALLQPILTMPLWQLGSPVLGFRLVQVFNSLAMALAAVPLYLIARRIGLGKAFALLCALACAFTPAAYFAAYVLSNPVSYPLALTALLIGIDMLVAPSWRNQALYVVVASLAAFASLQFVVLLAAAPLAALIMQRGRIHRAARELWLVSAVCAVGGIAMLVAGRSGTLGYYSGGPSPAHSIGPWLGWARNDILLLALRAGPAIVPGALVALALALVRPRARHELAFAATSSSCRSSRSPSSPSTSAAGCRGAAPSSA